MTDVNPVLPGNHLVQVKGTLEHASKMPDEPKIDWHCVGAGKDHTKKDEKMTD